MRNQFRLDHRHYYSLCEEQVQFMVRLRNMGSLSMAEFVRGRVRLEVMDWLQAYPKDTWDVRHITKPAGNYAESDYWLFTDDDQLATLFKLTWL